MQCICHSINVVWLDVSIKKHCLAMHFHATRESVGCGTPKQFINPEEVILGSIEIQTGCVSNC